MRPFFLVISFYSFYAYFSYLFCLFCGYFSALESHPILKDNREQGTVHRKGSIVTIACVRLSSWALYWLSDIGLHQNDRE